MDSITSCSCLLRASIALTMIIIIPDAFSQFIPDQNHNTSFMNVVTMSSDTECKCLEAVVNCWEGSFFHPLTCAICECSHVHESVDTTISNPALRCYEEHKNTQPRMKPLNQPTTCQTSSHSVEITYVSLFYHGYLMYFTFNHNPGRTMIIFFSRSKQQKKRC